MVKEESLQYLAPDRFRPQMERMQPDLGTVEIRSMCCAAYRKRIWMVPCGGAAYLACRTLLDEGWECLLNTREITSRFATDLRRQST
ncbi:MAG: hypothetical protein OJF50_002607 [Nitrospira sp.]|nr:hypothetical protein [Nitrospira sp.]